MDNKKDDLKLEPIDTQIDIINDTQEPEVVMSPLQQVDELELKRENTLKLAKEKAHKDAAKRNAARKVQKQARRKNRKKK